MKYEWEGRKRATWIITLFNWPKKRPAKSSGCTGTSMACLGGTNFSVEKVEGSTDAGTCMVLYCNISFLMTLS
jgi:hypothetical protein